MLHIKQLEVSNWKSLIHFKKDFDKYNIINQPNGTGKSSMFQAIIFGLYGKLPPGFNLNTIRNTTQKVGKTLVRFDYNNDEYEVYRQFGSSSYIAVKKNGNTVAASSREAYNYIDNILPYQIMSVLWAPNTLSGSNILKPSFLVDHLLNYIFKDPKDIQQHYKYEIFSQNKIINNIKSRIGNKSDIESEIDFKIKEQNEIKDKLKTKFSSSNENAAKMAKDAQETLSSVNWDDFNILDDTTIVSFNKLIGRNDPERVLEDLNSRLEREKQKDNSDILEIDTKSLIKIKKLSIEKCKCLICDNDWGETTSEKLDKAINNPYVRDDKIISSLEEKIKIINSIKKEDVEATLNYKRLKDQLSRCPDWKEILDNIDKNNEMLWQKFDSLDREIKELSRIVDLKKDLANEIDKVKSMEKRLNLVSKYIDFASNKYSNDLRREASKILAHVNSRYQEITLENNSYMVGVINKEMTSISYLAALQLSSGEKTLIAISLILAAHKLFFSSAPLLFDESFSALDEENVVNLKEILKSAKNQMFIITHDKKWIDN